MRSIGCQCGREQLSHRAGTGLGVLAAHVVVPAQTPTWSGPTKPCAPRGVDVGVDDRVGVCRGLGDDVHATLTQAACEDLEHGGGRHGSAVRVEEPPTAEGALDSEPHRVDGWGTARIPRGGGMYEVGEFARQTFGQVGDGAVGPQFTPSGAVRSGAEGELHAEAATVLPHGVETVEKVAPPFGDGFSETFAQHGELGTPLRWQMPSVDADRPAGGGRERQGVTGEFGVERASALAEQITPRGGEGEGGGVGHRMVADLRGRILDQGLGRGDEGHLMTLFGEPGGGGHARKGAADHGDARHGSPLPLGRRPSLRRRKDYSGGNVLRGR